MVKKLRITAVVSIIMIIGLLGFKVNMDAQYNKDTFEEFYEQYKQPNNRDSKNSNKISIGLSGVKIATSKEAYIDESVNAYTNFSVKVIYNNTCISSNNNILLIT